MLAGRTDALDFRTRADTGAPARRHGHFALALFGLVVSFTDSPQTRILIERVQL